MCVCVQDWLAELDDCVALVKALCSLSRAYVRFMVDVDQLRHAIAKYAVELAPWLASMGKSDEHRTAALLICRSFSRMLARGQISIAEDQVADFQSALLHVFDCESLTDLVNRATEGDWKTSGCHGIRLERTGDPLGGTNANYMPYGCKSASLGQATRGRRQSRQHTDCSLLAILCLSRRM